MTDSETSNKAIIQDLLAAADRGDMSAVERYYATDYVDHNPSPGRSTADGIEGVRRAFHMFHEAFPDTRHEVRDLIAEGDRVVARTYAVATHTGELMGVAATGRRVRLEAIAIYRIADGKIAERWCYQGRGVLEQLTDAG
jgi:steroid delta-isomerase-like uncharacterized protein